MGGGRGPHRRLDQGGGVQLEADAEQQQDHTEIGHGLETLTGAVAHFGEHEPGGEVADQRRQPGAGRDEAESECHQDDLERHVGGIMAGGVLLRPCDG